MKQMNEVIYHFKKRIHEYVQKRKRKSFPREVSIRNSSKMLEIGCGARFTYRADQRVAEYGLDIVPEMIRFLKRHYPTSHGIVGSALYLPFRNDAFDVVIANALLHHLIGESPSGCVKNIKTALDEMNRVVKSNGFVLVKELIARSRILSYFMFYVTYVCAKLSININWLDIHDKVIVFFMDEKTFKNLALKAKFDVKKIESKKWVITRFGVNLGEQIEFLLTPKR